MNQGCGGQDISLDAAVKLATEQATLRFPVQVMLALQQTVGKQLLAQAGARTATAGARAIPFISGVVGGSVDATSMQYSAMTAKFMFAKAARKAAEETAEAKVQEQAELEAARPTEEDLREEIERLSAEAQKQAASRRLE